LFLGHCKGKDRHPFFVLDGDMFGDIY